MTKEEFNKSLLKQCHDNTHSTGRILRNVELIRRTGLVTEEIETRLKIIEQSTLECRKQVDEIYLNFKEI